MFNPEAYRSRFPILQSTVHFANCSQGPLSLDVIEAIHRYEDSLSHTGMDWGTWMEEVELARKEFATLIGADPENIAVSGSVSEALSAIASCFPLYGRKHVVTTVDEFPTVGQIWLAHAQHERASVTFVRSPDGFYTADLLEPYLSNNTAVLCVHFVSYYNATRQNVQELAKLAHQHGAILVVDAYQGLGTVPLDVITCGADVVISGTLKYLLGLPGIAFMYVHPDLSADLQPAMTGWLGRRNPFEFDPTRLDFAPGARRFDMGTPPVIAAYAALAGLRLIQEVGVTNIAQHIQDISQHLITRAQEYHLDIASPLNITKKGAAVAIRVGDRAPEIERALLQRHIAVSARRDVIRIAPHLFTTLEDVEIVLSELFRQIGTFSTI